MSKELNPNQKVGFDSTRNFLSKDQRHRNQNDDDRSIQSLSHPLSLKVSPRLSPSLPPSLPIYVLFMDENIYLK